MKKEIRINVEDGSKEPQAGTNQSLRQQRHERAQQSEARIAALLESALLDSEWIQECNAALRLDEFRVSKERVYIGSKLVGTANGKEFSFHIEQDYILEDGAGDAVMFFHNPVAGVVAMFVRRVTEESDPLKKKEHWLTRCELEAASGLESKINRLVSAPLTGTRAAWRRALVGGIVIYVLAAVALGAAAYSKHINDTVIEGLVVAVLFGGLFSIPAGLSGLSLGLLFVGRDVEETVFGQSMMRMVGVKSLLGVRTVSLVGIILGGVVYAITFRSLIFR